jgi:hypothetical protein
MPTTLVYIRGGNVKRMVHMCVSNQNNCVMEWMIVTMNTWTKVEDVVVSIKTFFFFLDKMYQLSVLNVFIFIV